MLLDDFFLNIGIKLFWYQENSTIDIFSSLFLFISPSLYLGFGAFDLKNFCVSPHKTKEFQRSDILKWNNSVLQIMNRSFMRHSIASYYN